LGFNTTGRNPRFYFFLLKGEFSMLNQNLYMEQARLNKQRFNEKVQASQTDPNADAEYYRGKNEAFRERTKKIRMPLAMASGVSRMAISSASTAKKAISQGEELSLFQKAVSSEVVSQIINSPVFGSLYGLSKGFGRRQRIQEEKALAPQMGLAGKAGRLSNIYSQAGTAFALPMMASLAMGKGTLGLHGLTSTLTGGAMAPMMGVMALQMAARMWAGSAKTKLRPKRVSEPEIVNKYSVSNQFQGQINRLLMAGQLQPADMLKLQYLGIIADRVGPLSAIYSEMDLQRQEKEKGSEAFESSYSERLYGSESEKGLFDKTLDFLEGSLTKTLAKYSPFQQITDALFGGEWNPKKVQEELAEQYGYKDVEEMNREEAAKFGINVDQHRLLVTTSQQLISSAVSFEAKNLALLSGMYDIGRLQALELATIRRHGFGVADNLLYSGKVEDKTIFERISDFFENFSIPGVNAIANIIKFPFKLPKMLAEKFESGFEKVEKFVLGDIAKFAENQDEVLKELGLYKSTEEQSKEFIARGLPDVLSELKLLSEKKLDVLENIYDVVQRHYEFVSGLSHQKRVKGREKLIWDEITNQFVTPEEYEYNRELEKKQIETYVEGKFRKSFLGILTGRSPEKLGTMEKATGFFHGAREKLGLEYGYRSIGQSIEAAQSRRTTPESLWKLKGFSREEELKSREIEEGTFKRDLRNLKSGAYSAAGIGASVAAFSMLGPAGLMLAPLLVGAGVTKGIKNVLKDKKKLKEIALKETGGIVDEGLKLIKEDFEDLQDSYDNKRFEEIKKIKKEIEERKKKQRFAEAEKQKRFYEVTPKVLEEIKSDLVLFRDGNLTRLDKIYSAIQDFETSPEITLESSQVVSPDLSEIVTNIDEFRDGNLTRLDKIINLLEVTKPITASEKFTPTTSPEIETGPEFIGPEGVKHINITKPTTPTEPSTPLRLIINDIETKQLDLQAAAEGDVVTQPDLRLVGEGGEPEAIVPKSKIAEFFAPTISSIISKKFDQIISPFKKVGNVRNVAQELKEVEEKKKEKEQKSFRDELITQIEDITGVLKDIDEKTGISQRAKESIFGFLKGLQGFLSIGIKAITTAAAVFATMKTSGFLANMFSGSEHGELQNVLEGSGATGSKTEDFAIRSGRTAAMIGSRRLRKKLEKDLAKSPTITKIATSSTKEKLLKSGQKLTTGVVEKVGEKTIAGKLFSKTSEKIGEKAVKALGKKEALTAGKSIAKAVGGRVVKQTAKNVLKYAAPGVSIAIGGALAIDRFRKGEIGKGFLELASGLLASVPGIGTLASIGIDTYLLMSDIKKSIEMNDPKYLRKHFTPEALKLIDNDPSRLNELLQSGKLILNKDIGKYDTIDSEASRKILEGDESLTKDLAKRLADTLAKEDVVNRNWIGKSKIEDWSKAKELSASKLLALSKYEDFSKETQQRLKELYEQKTDKGVVPSGKVQSEIEKTKLQKTEVKLKKVELEKLDVSIEDLKIIKNDRRFIQLMIEYSQAVKDKDKATQTKIENIIKKYYPQHSIKEWYKMWLEVKNAINKKELPHSLMFSTIEDLYEDINKPKYETKVIPIRKQQDLSLTNNLTSGNFNKGFMSSANIYTEVRQPKPGAKIYDIKNKEKYKNQINILKDPDFLQYIESVSNKYGVNSALVKAVIEQESSETQNYVQKVPQRMAKYERMTTPIGQPVNVPEVKTTVVPELKATTMATQTVTQPQQPIVVAQQPETPAKDSFQETKQPIDSDINKSIENIFASSSIVLEDSTKKYALDSAVNFG